MGQVFNSGMLARIYCQASCCECWFEVWELQSNSKGGTRECIMQSKLRVSGNERPGYTNQHNKPQKRPEKLTLFSAFFLSLCSIQVESLFLIVMKNFSILSVSEREQKMPILSVAVRNQSSLMSCEGALFATLVFLLATQVASSQVGYPY